MVTCMAWSDAVLSGLYYLLVPRQLRRFRSKHCNAHLNSWNLTPVIQMSLETWKELHWFHISNEHPILRSWNTLHLHFEFPYSPIKLREVAIKWLPLERIYPNMNLSHMGCTKGVKTMNTRLLHWHQLLPILWMTGIQALFPNPIQEKFKIRSWFT